MKRKRILVVATAVVAVGFLMLLLPFRNPVDNALPSDYHPQSYWYSPWGTSITHKGDDIFKRNGQQWISDFKQKNIIVNTI